MPVVKPTLTVTKDFTKDFFELVGRYKKDSVVVGIPEAEDSREGDDADIGNAQILAMNHFGSEANNIPPRPVLEIGIRKAQPAIAAEFKNIAMLSLKKGLKGLEQGLERVGIIASNSVKNVINTQDGIAPPSEATLNARKYLTKTGFKGVKALLVTGQLRNSITYVVKSVWGR